MAQIQDAVGNPILANVAGSGSLGALNAEVLLSVFGQAGAAFQIEGIGTLTISFEGTVDGSTWHPITGIRPDTGASASSATTNGIWLFATMGYLRVRARVSAYTSGTADVAGIAGQGALQPPFGGGGGGGGLTDAELRASPVPVSIPIPAPVSDNGGSLTVDGTVSISGVASVLLTDGVHIADVTPAGAVTVDGSAVTQPISAASLPLPTGAATAALQTQPGVDIGDVTVNNGAAGAAVNIQDGGNSITVDGAVSITGAVDTELPAAAAMADGAANPTAPAVDARQMVYNGATWDRRRGDTSGAFAQGPAAHDAASAGNPVRIGAKANLNEPTAVSADSDVVDVWADRLGRQVVLDGHSNPESPVTVNLTASGDTQVIAAPGASLSIYVQKASVHNRAGTARQVSLREGAAGTIRWSAEVGANGGGSLIDFGARGWKIPANTALTGNLDNAGDVDVNITQYYIAA